MSRPRVASPRPRLLPFLLAARAPRARLLPRLLAALAPRARLRPRLLAARAPRARLLPLHPAARAPRARLLPLLLAAGIAATAPACKRETPEAVIRRIIDDTCAALEARDVARAVRHLSPSYRDQLARTSQQMRGLAFFVLRRGPVTVLLRDTEITVTGENATVTTVAHAFQGRARVDRLADLVPQGAQRFELTIAFAREGSDWKVRALDGDWTNPDLGM